MYDIVDRPVAALCRGSRFLLWAMRAWANASRRGRRPQAWIGGAFVNMGAAAAIVDFNDAMRRLRGSGLEFAPLGRRTVDADEAVMIALWADLVVGRHERALGLLRLMLPVAAAELAAESLAGAGDHLCHAGLAPLGLAEGCGIATDDLMNHRGQDET